MIDCTQVVLNMDEDEVIISGIDLDAIWIHKDEPDEDDECMEVSYKFDTKLAGNRKYLYLMTKNNKKASEFKYMDERLQALVGQTIHVSPNFRVKD